MARYTGPSYKKSRTVGFSTLETGKVIKVPLFIEEGEELLISSKDGKYVSRA